ncbi:MAG: hypothetical protein PVS3B3_33500 [Ktedonobacteraceae bacterium]
MNTTDETYIYIRETKHLSPDEALMAAFRDIEHDLAEPIEIVDKNGDLIHDSETIYEMFVKSNHEPIEPPPTIRARVIEKPTSKKPDLLDWIVSKLHGKPEHWQ